MFSRSLVIAGLLASATVALHAQSESRTVGIRTAGMAIRDGAFARGTRISLDVHAESEEGSFHAGVVEGLIQAGMTVSTEDTASEADVNLSFILRGKISGDVTVSVIGMDLRESRYLFSSAYVIPIQEQTVIESLLAPVVVVTSAVLIVYLLLTVRSS